jgi:hypothetical protein
VLLALTVHSALVHSATCDEIGAHIPAGHLYWTSGHYSGGLDNFPLGQLLIALPVRALGLGYTLFSEQHLFLFRLPVVLLTLLLGLLTYAYARDLFGGAAAQVALALLAVSPAVLAHGSLATLDLPTAFFVLLALWRLLRYVTAPSTWRLLGFSLALGLAVATKVQALLLLPLAAVLLLAERPDLERRSTPRRLLLVVMWLLLPLAAVVLVVCVTYLHDPLTSGTLLPKAFLQALRGKLQHGGTGHFAYLLGKYSEHGWWYYFPVAIAVKTAPGTLLLAAAGLFTRPSRRTGLFVLLPAAAFLALAMLGRVDIGLRHLLIVYPLLFALAGHGAERLWQSRLAPVAPLLLVWSLVETAWVAPHYLSYFNELAGGTSDGHRVLVDSNYDWGQNDHFLRRYLARSGRACQIDPDAFTPASGCVVVNANALYGVLNGGPAAYRWLKDQEPSDRVAYTWFVYDLPETGAVRPRGPLPEQAQRHLLFLRQRYSDGILDPGFRLSLATALAFSRGYREAFAEISGLLARDPAFTPALALGGELTVRRKLGVLYFEDEEYLRGFPQAPPPAALDAPTLRALAAVPTASRLLGETHYQLGRALAEAGRRTQALEVLRQGLIFEGGRDDARRLVDSLESESRTATR